MFYDSSIISKKDILSSEEKEKLSSLSRGLDANLLFLNNVDIKKIMIDFVYTSAKIEGNTYSLLETEALINSGIVVESKAKDDAIMILNLREAFYDLHCLADKELEREDIISIHKTLSKGLLPAWQQGRARISGVEIRGSKYVPMDKREFLENDLDVIVANANSYEDIFEKSIYTHCNLAYLQYFYDVNKRTARMVQTGLCVQKGVMPLLFFEEQLNEYVEAVLNYYETGDYSLYKSFYLSGYEKTVSALGEILKAQPPAIL